MKRLIALPLLFALTASAEVLPTKPFIRVEVEQHTGPIFSIAADPSGQWLVTGSTDKTARLWDVLERVPVVVYRVPVGSGDTSRVLAVAIAPDAKLVAVGGLMHENSVYLFDRASGRLVRRLKGATSGVLDLAFSPDGARLVAAQMNGGLRAWRVKDGASAGQDKSYEGPVTGISFDRAGRLITSAADGQLRLYDAKLKLTKKAAAPSGQHPVGVQFSPDGTKASVCYLDLPAVDVITTATLALAFKPDLSKVVRSRLLKAVWSPDGQQLIAGGTTSVIRRWDKGGQGAPVDVRRETMDPVTDLEPLPDGVLFSAGDPAWAVLRFAEGEPHVVGPRQADFRGLQVENLKLSPNGNRVRFSIDPKGKELVEFNVETRALTFSPPNDAVLTPARQSAHEVDFGRWRGSPDIALNGRSLGFGNEIARTLAINSNGTGFVVGSDRSLRAFTIDGKPLWVRDVPAIPFATNIAGNGAVVVTAYGDGTLRWQRMYDGEELLALFVHPPSKEWVLFTPDGYFDHSENGAVLVGWVKNQGKEHASDLEPSSLHRSQFRRPDVISRVLQELNVEVAVEKAAAARGAGKQRP